jgi:hypothetical protein
MRVLPALSVLAILTVPAFAEERLRFNGDALFRAESATHFEPAAKSPLARVRPALTFAATQGVALLAQGQWYAGEALIYQAYVDVARESLQLRAGRQEIVLGSGFLLGADTFHDGTSFDAVRVQLRPRAGVTLDAFAGLYVPENAGGAEGVLYGTGVLLGSPESRALEAYGIRSTAGELETDTVSVRALMAHGPLRLEVEPARQRGAGEPSWGGHADVSCALGEALVGASYAWADPGFRHPDHDIGYVGDIGVVGDLSCVVLPAGEACGLSGLSARAELPVGRKTRLGVAVHGFRAEVVPANTSHGIGRELNLVLTQGLGRHASVTLSANRFDGAGDFRVLHGYVGVEFAW